MIKTGFVGWRGMVGSVLMERMQTENDFKNFEAVFFSTSQVGQQSPYTGLTAPLLQDAYDIDLLSENDIIVTCQGSGYTKKIHPELRASGWDGYWIDAASALRMDKESIIVLDPVNLNVIQNGLKSGIKNFIGGNCTVSLMLMAIGGLFNQGLIEWMTSMTYQAASGAGAKNMRELVAQMAAIGKASKDLLDNPAAAIQEIDKKVFETITDNTFPVEHFDVPLAGSVIPWIDTSMESGQSREEWKGAAETNKILQTKNSVPIDGLCVRVGLMRCHSQAFTVKLSKDLPLSEVQTIIESANKWVKIIPNTKEDSVKYLTPAAVTGQLTIPVGRIRKLNIGPEYLTMFTVGDQLLWGAAEPIRRMLNILIDYII